MHEGKSEGYFKQAVYGLRYWFRMFGMKETALRMPPIKRKQTLSEVLSKQECKELFKAPRTLKHRFLLAFAYEALSKTSIQKNASMHTLRQIDLRW